MSAPASPANGMHAPCCSAHGVDMTCERYRRTHFVEVRPCCTNDAAVLDAERAQRQAAYDEGRWCGECEYGVVMDPPCCTAEASPEPAGHPFAAILDGTAAAPRTAFPRSVPEHLRTDDMPSYLAAKGDGTGMGGWS